MGYLFNINREIFDLIFNNNPVLSLKWWEIAAIAMYNEDPNKEYKPTEVLKLEFVKKSIELKNVKSPSIATELRECSDDLSTNYKRKNRNYFLRNGEFYKLSEEGKNYIQTNFQLFIKRNNLNFNHHKNQILYGPPGTGKTYNTVIRAMEIINNEKYDFVDDKQYEKLKKDFDKLKQQGQIEFVTFHQSYSYEEFVEGIKPYIPEWGTVEENNRFIGQDGILKKIAKDALYSSLTLNNNIKNSELFYRIIEKFKEEYPIGSILQTQENNNFEIVNYTETSIRIQPVTEKRSTLSISYQPLEEMYILNKKNKINTRKNLEIAMNDRYKGLSSYYLPILKIIEKFKVDDKNIKQGKEFKEKLIKEFYQNKILLEKNNGLRYVLVIDEINRGDVSKIFGELITLIEKDKRIGKEHQMTVTLPYSRETFGVPNNLYIIGTMNTADRSIALLDTALRRRFDFEEMMPKPEKIVDENQQPQMVEDINLQNLLKNINERISHILDRDHQIGHSYLMGIKNKEQLEKAYKNRILPLLNEYFYNDIDSVAKVLNCKSDEISSKENWFNVLKEAQKPTKKK